MDIWKDYYKVLDVIDSCRTVDQLKGAEKMLELWRDKHLDEQVFSSTYRNHVQKKLKELNEKEYN